MNPTASSRTFLAALLFIGLCLSTAAAAPKPPESTATIKDGTSWKTVPFGADNKDALLKVHPFPPYPWAARRVNAGGRGRFKLNFGADGKVKNIEVLQSTGNKILDDACLSGFGAWQARHPGELKSVVQKITFTMHRPR